MYVGITGSRDLEDPAPVSEVLHECLSASTERFERLHVYVGDCPTGADLFARQWAHDREGVEVSVFKANWKKYGRAAGPRRNSHMMERLRYINGNSVVFAFYKNGAKNRGTESCHTAAKAYGHEVFPIWCD